MTIEELAKRKVELQAVINGIGMCNIYGKTKEEIIDLELSKIKALKELNQVDSQIKDYITNTP